MVAPRDLIAPKADERLERIAQLEAEAFGKMPCRQCRGAKWFNLAPLFSTEAQVDAWAKHNGHPAECDLCHGTGFEGGQPSTERRVSLGAGSSVSADIFERNAAAIRQADDLMRGARHWRFDMGRDE